MIYRQENKKKQQKSARWYKKALAGFLSIAMFTGNLGGIPLQADAAENSPSNSEFEVIRYVPNGEPSDTGYQAYHYVDLKGNEIEPEVYQPIKSPYSNLKSEELPVSYDLRDEDRLTAVKTQVGGTCWAYSAMAAFESNMITKGLADTTINYSEPHFVYYTKKQHIDNESDPNFGDGVDAVSKESYMLDGGNNSSAIAGLANWSGTQLDSNKSFTSLLTDAQLEAMFEEDERYVSYAHLKNAIYLDTSDYAGIKKAIMKYGALAMSYHDVSTAYGTDGISFYQPADEAKQINHAICVVGWDDNYGKENFDSSLGTPAANGAWLCRNSWGPQWGDRGYFWISYEEGTQGEFRAFEMDTVNDYQNNYSHTGADSIWRINVGKYANVFNANNNEILRALSLVHEAGEVPAEISVYTGIPEEADPTEGTLRTTQRVTLRNGFQTIELNQSVSLQKGERFSICVKMLTNTPLNIAIEGTQGVSTRGESYYGNSGGSNWYDAHDTTYLYEGKSYRYNNFYIHALTDNQVYEVSLPQKSGITIKDSEGAIITGTASVDQGASLTFSIQVDSGYEAGDLQVSYEGTVLIKEPGTNTYTLIPGKSGSLVVEGLRLKDGLFLVGGEAYEDRWHTEDIIITPVNPADVVSYKKTSEEAYSTPAADIVLGEEGTIAYQIQTGKSEDSSLVSTASEITLKLDKTEPNISGVTIQQYNMQNVNDGYMAVINAADSISGIEAYSIDGGSTWKEEGSIRLSPESGELIAANILVRDRAGNIGTYTGSNLTVPTGDYQALTGLTATASSEAAAQSNEASKAVDGNDQTIWHTAWSAADGGEADFSQNSYTITLPQVESVGKLEYVPRQDNSNNGRIHSYRIEYSTQETGENFTALTTGTWAQDATTKTAEFAPVSARRIRIYAVSSEGDTPNKFVSAAEFRLFGIQYERPPVLHSVEFPQLLGIQFQNSNNENLIGTIQVLDGGEVSFKIQTQEGYDSSNISVYNGNTLLTKGGADGFYRFTPTGNSAISVQGLALADGLYQFNGSESEPDFTNWLTSTLRIEPVAPATSIYFKASDATAFEDGGNVVEFSEDGTVTYVIKPAMAWNGTTIYGLEKSITIKMDQTAPGISNVVVQYYDSNAVNQGYQLLIQAADSGSGLAEYSIDGGTTWTSDSAYRMPIGGTRIPSANIQVKDEAGNIAIYSGPEIVVPGADYRQINGLTGQAYSESAIDSCTTDLALDNDPATLWHSAWSDEDGVVQFENNYYIITLPGKATIGKLSYLPRQDNGSNGIITGFELSYSVEESGETFIPLTSGTWSSDATEKTVEFNPVQARRIRVKATATAGVTANEFVSAAGFSVFAVQYEQNSAESELRELYNRLSTLLSADYTEDSYLALEQALSRAQALLDTGIATDLQLTQAKEAVLEAEAGLKRMYTVQFKVEGVQDPITSTRIEAGGRVILPETPAELQNKIYIWSVDGQTAIEDNMTVTGDTVISAKILYEDEVFTGEGGSIRFESPWGIRFKTKLPVAVMDADLLEEGFQVVEYGTLVAKTSQLGDNELVLGLANEVCPTITGTAYNRFEAVDSYFSLDEQWKSFTVVLTDISDANLKTDYSTRPYMIYRDNKGNKYTIYGSVQIRSAAYIAQRALDDPAGNYSVSRISDLQAILRNSQ